MKLKGLRYVIRGVIGVLLATQLNPLYNHLKNSYFPSEIRTEFREEFGFPINGWEEDIENSPKNVELIKRVLREEQLEKPFDLKSINIVSNKFTRRGFFDNNCSGVSPPRAHYHRDTNEICLYKKGVNEKTIHHEIKHAKTNEVRKEHPEFFDRWNELAKDEDGNSLYYSKLDYLFKMFGIQKSYDETFSFEDNFLGFFSNYSRSNIWEDIAVTSTTLEMPGWKYYIKSILDHNDESGNIKRKISLAREYGLLP